MRIQDDYEAGAQQGARDERGRVATYLRGEAFEYRAIPRIAEAISALAAEIERGEHWTSEGGLDPLAEPAKPVAKQGSRLITLYMDPEAMEGARRRQAARQLREAYREYMEKLAEIGEVPEEPDVDTHFGDPFYAWDASEF